MRRRQRLQIEHDIKERKRSPGKGDCPICGLHIGKGVSAHKLWCKG